MSLIRPMKISQVEKLNWKDLRNYYHLKMDLCKLLGDSYYMGLEAQERLRFVSNSLKSTDQGELRTIFTSSTSSILMNNEITRFWGVFWIDASTYESIKRGLTQITPFKKNSNIGFHFDQSNYDDDLELETGDSMSGANEERSLKHDIEKMVGACGLTKKREAPSAANVDRVMNTLSAVKEPWLIIFDNADDDELKLDAYIPMSEYGTVLVTTRNEHLEMKGGADTVNVTSLGEKDAVEVFRKARKIEHDQWKAKSKKYIESVRGLVMEQLGGLPLAINQAASHMRKKSLEPAQYTKRLEEKRAELLSDIDTMANNTYHLPVWSTWEVSVDAISEKATDSSRDALELLYLFACFNHRHIPQRLFRRAWKRVNDGMVAEEWIGKMTGGREWFKIHQPDIFRIGREDDSWTNIEERFDSAMELLTSYSLIAVKSSEDVHRNTEKDAEDRWIYMHPLVHTWAYDRLDTKTRERSLTVATFMACLSASAPYRGGRDQVNWLFRDLAHNFERLATRFIEHKAKYNGALTKEQVNIVKGLWASLVITLQWGKARRLRREILGSATQFVVSRAKSGTTATVQYIKKYGSSPNLKGKGFSPSLRGRSPSPSPNLCGKSPPLLGQDGFGEPIPLTTPPIEEEPPAEVQEENTGKPQSRGSYSSMKGRANAAFMRKASPYLRSKRSSQFQVEECGDQLDNQDVAAEETALPQDPLYASTTDSATSDSRSHNTKQDEKNDTEATQQTSIAQAEGPRPSASHETPLLEPDEKNTPSSNDPAATDPNGSPLFTRDESGPHAPPAKLSRIQRALMQRTKHETTAFFKKRPLGLRAKNAAVAQGDEVSEDAGARLGEMEEVSLVVEDTALVEGGGSTPVESDDVVVTWP